MKQNSRDPGSSPRLRGTPEATARFWGKVRFIPASAGNTTIPRLPCSRLSVHPRVCGEHIRRRPPLRHTAGSSPRLRGTRHRESVTRCRYRFIPASAGNTTPAFSYRHVGSVHPRVCGEHHTMGIFFVSPFGSSPRLRGTRWHEHYFGNSQRFIPASAGNTVLAEMYGVSRSVHPRVCGEHVSLPSVSVAVAGSSPRLRGTRYIFPRLHQCIRFIPASAGNTYHGLGCAQHDAVHPRVCGEH